MTKSEERFEKRKIIIKMDIRFDGKRALVTGAGKGIGRSVAIRLAECGTEVIAISRTKSDLEELSKSFKGIKTLCLDVSDWEKTKSTISEIDPIDLLVNNAGILTLDKTDVISTSQSEDVEKENFDGVFDINVKAIINITQIVAKGMIERGLGGSIVNVSSISSHFGYDNSVMQVYSSSKAAVDSLTRSIAVKYGPHNIRCNAVNPIIIRTPMAEKAFDLSDAHERAEKNVPLRRLGEVDEVAYPILFLLSEMASLINGVTLRIDGGRYCKMAI